MDEKENVVNSSGAVSDNGASVKAEKTENLSKKELKAIRKENTRAEKREWNERRRIKRGKKALCLRKVKNFMFFVAGIFAGIAILFSGIFIGAKLVPSKTYFGDDYVNSETAGKESIIDFVLNRNQYQISDVPVLSKLLDDLINGSGLNSLFTVDSEKLKQTKFDSIGEGILNSAKISSSVFGDLADLEMFTTTPVPAGEEPTEEEITNPESNIYKVYYYLKEENGLATYERAFTDDREMAEGAEGAQLYYLSLSDMNINDMKDVFSERFKLLKVKSIFKTLADVEEDNFINDVFGDKSVKDLSGFEKSDIKIETALGEYDEEKNGKLYNLIWDACHYVETENETTHKMEISYEEVPTVIDSETGEPAVNPETGKVIPDYSSLTLADLSGDKFDIDMVRLITVLGDANTESKDKLFKVVWDASRYVVDEITGEITYEIMPEIEDPENPGTYKPDYSLLNLKDLSGEYFDIDMVKLGTVLKDNGDNLIITKLLADEDVVRLGNLSDKINKMRIADLYDIECFTQIAEQTKDTSVRYEKKYDDVNGYYYYEKTDASVVEGGNVYYIHGVAYPNGEEDRPAGIWLFTLYDNGSVNADFSYNPNAIDEHGYAKIYIDKDLRFENLRGNINNASGNFMYMTVRQMFMAGLLNPSAPYSDNVMALTLNDVLTAHPTAP